ncbi:unnamed protein product [Effrenium voratum]|uniref:non-specific serine/threonine protein kinase n=1 Tax=Effrenium voratum TaxID=2562239 RepID=A0AA36NN51_9DINO|nr:unnamed protein product [Effrenium voratum]
MHEREGDVVVKLFIHREGQPDLKELQRRIHQVRDALRTSWLHPNVLPYQAMEMSSQSSVLLRQHFVRNLNDRIHTRPFLSCVEKKWLAFQVIASVCQAHSAGVVHGDLKTENVFVSSWSHVMLTDFATFKPLFLPQDDPSEFSFFFESDRNRHRCYLAPERFDSGAASRGRFSRELASMDIFSLGCVLSELFQDGQTLLDLPQLRAYRLGGDIREKLSGLNPDMQELVSSMLSRDPCLRKSGIEYLRDWCRILPRSFCSCLFPLSVLLIHPLYQQPDMRVALLRHNFAAIVWLTAGARQIGGSLGIRGSEEDANVWQAWHQHVSRASNLDGVMHSVVSNALQAASQCQDWGFDAEAKEKVGTHGFVQPLLNEATGSEFTTKLFQMWEQGCERCANGGQIDEGDQQDHSVYVSFLASLCQNSPASMPGSGQPGEDAEALNIVCGLIASCTQHVMAPRARLACLEMLQLLVPFSSQDTILEQILPYSHLLMTDSVSKVRAKSVDVLCTTLAEVHHLPASHAPLFTEYIFPQLMSMMSGMSNEPVVLLSVARNIGALATHARRCAELTASTPAQGQEVVDTFDVQLQNLQEALKKIVKALLELLPMHSPERSQEELLMSLSVGREVKIGLLRNMCVLADCFGREGTHNFLLPYLISFMNDPAWEVRAAFCAEAALLPRRVGQVSLEGIIWPCYEQALLDQEERVLEAALLGLTKLVAQQVLRRQSLVTVANKVAALLVHPSEQIRSYASQVVEALAAELTEVDQYVFLLPAVRPYLLANSHNFRVPLSLVEPLPRQRFKDLLNEEVPQTTDRAWELLRPYLQPLLRSRPSRGSGSTLEAPQHLTAGKVQCIQYVTVNPHCAASQSLAACAEAKSSDHHSWMPLMPRGLQHPLGFLSLQAYLVKAFCLPPKLCDLGALSFLDGTPYSMYALPSASTSTTLSVRAEIVEGDRGPMLQESFGSMHMQDAEFSVDAVSMAGSDRASPAPAFRGLWPRYEGAEASHGSPNQTWRPRGQLLTTLYEYAHQSGVPVVKADTTDDSRVLVTGGRDGTVKLWSCAQLESDTAPGSAYSATVSRSSGLRALRTIRNSKAFAVGTSDGEVLLYKVESSRSGAKLSQAAQWCQAGAVMCIEQFDTELESLVIFAQEHGALRGWDLRGPKDAWALQLPWLGVPSSVALARDGFGAVVGTTGGGLLVYDLRFLTPRKYWKVSSRASIMDMRSAEVGSSQGVFAALSSRCNEVALFDISQGSCLTLFLTDKPKEALSIPSLVEVPAGAAVDVPLSGIQRDGVRSLWLPPRGAQTFLLAAGTDRKVRHWSLDPDRPAQAYVVTADSGERPTYTSNHLGDVFVVQEGPCEAQDGQASPSPNHRDAILDMCTISLQQDILVTAGRDGLVKLWR